VQVLHFTPGCLDPDGFRKKGTVAAMPLAASCGASEISCVYLAPGGSVTVSPATSAQLYLVVNGQVTGMFDRNLRIEIWAGAGFVLEASESCRLESTAGAVLIAVESAEMTANPCGLSLPERVGGAAVAAFPEQPVAHKGWTCSGSGSQ